MPDYLMLTDVVKRFHQLGHERTSGMVARLRVETDGGLTIDWGTDVGQQVSLDLTPEDTVRLAAWLSAGHQ